MTVERQLDDYGRHLQQVIDQMEVPVRPTQPVRPATGAVRRGQRRWMISAAAAAVVAMVAAVVLLSSETTNTEPVGSGDQAPVTTVVDRPTVITGFTVEGGEASLVPASLELGRTITLARSGDTLWAWDGEGRLAGYHEGTWRSFPQMPGWADDVAGRADGTVWAGIPSGSGNAGRLVYLDGTEWREFTKLSPGPPNPRLSSIEVDEDTGVVWLASDTLRRWDGTEMTRAPGEHGITDIALTGDGTIWASGFNPMTFPWLGHLTRYHQDTGLWEKVRPLGGYQDVPAVALASTPNGNLWVLLAHWPEEVRYRSMNNAELTLAYRGNSTGGWALYPDLLPDGLPMLMVADDDAVWLAEGSGGDWTGDVFSGVVRFDGETQTRYLGHRTFDALGLGDDGTIWVSATGDRTPTYRLVIDPEADQ